MNKGSQHNRFLIYGFLRRILNKEESELFEESMKNESFQEQLTEETINQFGRIQLKSKLDEIHLQEEISQRRRQLLSITTVSIIAILLAIFCWKSLAIEDNSSKLKTNQIFATYFEPYPSLFNQKGETSEKELDFIKAMDAYTARDYKKAVYLFETISNNHKSKKSLQSFYYGIALLANQQPTKAKEILLQLKDRPNSPVPKQPLFWYLALSYIEENNVEEATPILESITTSSNGGFKQKEAKEILQILK